jgi:hypothetical protein
VERQWHNLHKFRLRGLLKVNIQALLTAAGQNIKRLLKQVVFCLSPEPASPDVLSCFIKTRGYFSQAICCLLP